MATPYQGLRRLSREAPPLATVSFAVWREARTRFLPPDWRASFHRRAGGVRAEARAA